MELFLTRVFLCHIVVFSTSLALRNTDNKGVSLSCRCCWRRDDGSAQPP